MSSDEMKQLIDSCKEAVDRSAFGPLFQIDDTDFTKRQVNQLAFGVFTILLTGMIKNISQK
jgi:hypothetical protein